MLHEQPFNAVNMDQVMKSLSPKGVGYGKASQRLDGPHPSHLPWLLRCVMHPMIWCFIDPMID